MVNRWTDGSGNYRLRRPAGSGAGVVSNALASVHNALGGNRGPSAGWRAAREEQRNPRRSDGQISPRPSKEQQTAASKPKPADKPKPANKPKPLTENQRLARSNRRMDRSPAPTPTPPKPTPTKPKPRAASASDAQDLRRGRTPATPSTPSTPPKKKYGVKDGNNAKGRTKRLTDALNNLKVRKY